IVVAILALLFSSFFILRISDVMKRSYLLRAVGGDKEYSQRKTYDTNVYKKLDQVVPKDFVIFNCIAAHDNIEVMFYSNHTAYACNPSQYDFNALKTRKVKMAFFRDNQDSPL